MDPLLAQAGLGLGLATGKFLLKKWVGAFGHRDDLGVSPSDAEAAGEIAADAVADVVKDRIKDAMDRRATALRFEDVGNDIARRLVEALQAAHGDVPPDRWAPVLRRVQSTLAGNVSAEFVVQNRADSIRLLEALKAVPVHTPPLPPGDETLFDDALRTAARFLAAAADKLPGFDAAHVRQSLDVLDHVRAELGQTLDDVRAIRTRVEQLAGPDRGGYEADYRQAVVQTLGWVELFGVDLPADLRRVRLDDAYVSLMLEDESDAEPADDAPPPVSSEAAFADVLPRTGRLLVRGAAGGGKTTLVKWAATQAARLAPARPEPFEYEDGPDGVRIRPDAERDRLRTAADRDWRRRVPFVILLRNRQGGALPLPAEFPAAVAREYGSPPPGWVEQTLRDGRGLVLIDGIDEVPLLDRPALRSAVQRLTAFYPKSYFVLTTRPEAVEPGWLAADGFTDVWVDGLSVPARDALIRRWFEAAGRVRRPDPGAADDWTRRPDELIAALAHAPWLANPATSPMLCAMTCALFAARRGFLPGDLRQMCEVLTELMLHRLDEERRVDLSRFTRPYPQLGYKEKKTAVRQVAFHMVLNERSTLPVPQAVHQVGLALGRMPDRRADEAAAVFRGLLDRGGLWREAAPAEGDRPATVEFQHNTFKEFLAGEQMAGEGNAPFVLDRLDQAGGRQVGLFAVAAGTASFQNEFLGGLLARLPDALPKSTDRRPADERARQLAFYAYQCRPLALECDEPIKARLNALAAQLVPPRNFTDAACLAAGGNAAVLLLGYRHRPAAHQAACVRALKLIGTPEAAEALRAYWADKRHTVGVELQGTADPFEMMGDEIVRRLEAGVPLAW